MHPARRSDCPKDVPAPRVGFGQGSGQREPTRCHAGSGQFLSASEVQRVHQVLRTKSCKFNFAALVEIAAQLGCHKSQNLIWPVAAANRRKLRWIDSSAISRQACDEGLGAVSHVVGVRISMCTWGVPERSVLPEVMICCPAFNVSPVVARVWVPWQ